MFEAVVVVLLKTWAFCDAYAELLTFGRIITPLSSGPKDKYNLPKKLLDCLGLKVYERNVGVYESADTA